MVTKAHARVGAYIGEAGRGGVKKQKEKLSIRTCLLRKNTFGGSPMRLNLRPICGKWCETLDLVRAFALSSAE